MRTPTATEILYFFDDLGQPWPVHECYEHRFIIGAPPGAGIQATQAVDLDEPPPPQWQFVIEIDPEKAGSRKTYHIVGSVTELVCSAAKVLLEHPGSNPTTRAQLRDVLAGRNDKVRIVTGEGEAFSAFINLRDVGIGFNDIVAATIRVKNVLGQKVFVVTKTNVWRVG